jgi:hypothetical protein
MDLKIDKNDLLVLMQFAEDGLNKLAEGKSGSEVFLLGVPHYARLIDSIRQEALKAKEV